MKITAIILTYNEAHRIHTAITHAKKWADEVVVTDKGSTDGTIAIAGALGATVAHLPFSKQGHESVKEMAYKASNAWVWIFTPGEVPTREVIEQGRELAGDDADMVLIPHKHYSFGVHSLLSPWSQDYQPRLYNRGRVEFTGISHRPIKARRVKTVEYSESCHVLHQTHPGAADFMRSHCDYMENEAAAGTPDEAMERASRAIANYQLALSSDPALLAQAYAWRIYWLGVALHAWNRKHPHIKEDYANRAAAMLAQEWGLTDTPRA